MPDGYHKCEKKDGENQTNQKGLTGQEEKKKKKEEGLANDE
jgi:hypothetical protein